MRFLEGLCLRVVRIASSHHFMDGAGKRTTVPVHGKRLLKTGTLRGIDMWPAEFERLWHDTADLTACGHS